MGSCPSPTTSEDADGSFLLPHRHRPSAAPIATSKPSNSTATSPTNSGIKSVALRAARAGATRHWRNRRGSRRRATKAYASSPSERTPSRTPIRSASGPGGVNVHEHPFAGQVLAEVPLERVVHHPRTPPSGSSSPPTRPEGLRYRGKHARTRGSGTQPRPEPGRASIGLRKPPTGRLGRVARRHNRFETGAPA